jgi:hypothetical protein
MALNCILTLELSQLRDGKATFNAKTPPQAQPLSKKEG